MAAPRIQHFGLSLLFLFVFIVSRTQSQVDKKGLNVMADGLELPMAMSMYSGLEDDGDFDDGFVDLESEEEQNVSVDRRSLFWRRVHYYISYGALSANRIPCPPRSGRSYYTHNCFKSRAPVNPYIRGCSRITRCRR